MGRSRGSKRKKHMSRSSQDAAVGSSSKGGHQLAADTAATSSIPKSGSNQSLGAGEVKPVARCWQVKSHPTTEVAKEESNPTAAPPTVVDDDDGEGFFRVEITEGPSSPPQPAIPVVAPVAEKAENVEGSQGKTDDIATTSSTGETPTTPGASQAKDTAVTQVAAKKVTWTTTFTSKFPKPPSLPTAASVRQSMHDTFTRVSTMLAATEMGKRWASGGVHGNDLVAPMGVDFLDDDEEEDGVVIGNVDFNDEVRSRPTTPGPQGGKYHHSRETSELSSVWSEDGGHQPFDGSVNSAQRGFRAIRGKRGGPRISSGYTSGQDSQQSSRQGSAFRHGASSVECTPINASFGSRSFALGDSGNKGGGHYGGSDITPGQYQRRGRSSRRIRGDFSRQNSGYGDSVRSHRSSLNPTPLFSGHDGGGFAGSSLAPPPPYQFKRSLKDMAPVLAAAAYAVILESKGRNCRYQHDMQSITSGSHGGESPETSMNTQPGFPATTFLKSTPRVLSPATSVVDSDRCAWCAASSSVPPSNLGTPQTSDLLSPQQYSSTRAFDTEEKVPHLDLGAAVAEMQLGASGIAIPQPRSAKTRQELLDKAHIEEGIRDIIVKLSRAIRFSDAATKIFASSLVYLKRIVTSAPCDHFVVDDRNYRKIFILAVMEATKMYLEEHVRVNVRFADALDIPLSQLNRLEVEFLHLIDFQLVVYEADFVDTFEWIEEIAARRNIIGSCSMSVASQSQPLTPRTPMGRESPYPGGTSTPRGTPDVSALLNDFDVLLTPPVDPLTFSRLQQQQQQQQQHSPEFNAGRRDSLLSTPLETNTPRLNSGKLFSSKFTADIGTPPGPTNSSFSRRDSDLGELPPMPSSDEDSCSFFRRSRHRCYDDDDDDDDDGEFDGINPMGRMGGEQDDDDSDDDCGGMRPMRAVKMSPPRPYGQSPPSPPRMARLELSPSASVSTGYPMGAGGAGESDSDDQMSQMPAMKMCKADACPF